MMPLGKFVQGNHIIIIFLIDVSTFALRTNILENVNDNEIGFGMLFHEVLHGFDQTVIQTIPFIREMKIAVQRIRQRKDSPLYSAFGVLQRQI